MKLRDKLRICRIGNQYIIVSDTDNIDVTRVISLNTTAVFLWREAEKGAFTPQQLADALCAHYDVEPAKALADVERTLAVWRENALIEE
jgi:hypothetical protein